MASEDLSFDTSTPKEGEMKSKQLNDGSIVSRLETLALDVLVDHPDQKTYFRDYGEFEYETLKKDIKANGVKNPPDVLPPKNKAGLEAYTILSGHTRRNILLELGHTTAKILVRYDLIDASRAEIDRAFLLDNVARRQQDRLGQTRAAVGLFRLEKEQRKLSTVSSLLGNGELRDQIGKIVDMSGRNLGRYFHVLSAPIEVQDAFAAKKLTLIQAARVGGLNPGQQKQIASSLSKGEDPKRVFETFFPSRTHKHVKPVDALASFVRSLETAHADLADRVDSIGPNAVRKFESKLKQGRRLIRRVLGKLNEQE